MKYRPPLGISQPSDQSRAAEIDANNCRQRTCSSSSLRDGPRGILSPVTTLCCSVPAQSSHDLERSAAQKHLPPGSPKKEESVSGSWQPEESDGHGDWRLIVGFRSRPCPSIWTRRRRLVRPRPRPLCGSTPPRPLAWPPAVWRSSHSGAKDERGGPPTVGAWRSDGCGASFCGAGRRLDERGAGRLDGRGAGAARPPGRARPLERTARRGGAPVLPAPGTRRRSPLLCGAAAQPAVALGERERMRRDERSI